MNDSLATSYPLAAEPFARGRIAAIADAGQRRPIIVVLGMHRSGTSLCAHVLSAMGIDMADQIGALPSNAAGHWERGEIVEFHDRILGHFNRGYFSPFHDFSLPVAWWADPHVSQIRREIVAFLEKRMGHSEFGFKDPRTVRLMPIWHQIFNDLKLAPKIVLCLRNPAQVARSLNVRDGLDLEIGEYRWLIHMIDFFRYSSTFDVCTVEYEGWFRDPLANFEKLRTFLDVHWQQSEPDLGLLLSGIVKPALRHDEPDHRESSHCLVRSLYQLASSGAPARDARDQVSDTVSQFVGFQRLQEPFRRAFEALADTAAKLPRIEQEAAALEARLADALSEAEAQRASLAETAGERDAYAAALDAVRAELASARTALADVESSANAMQAALAEIDAQNAQITTISGERDQIASVLASTREELAVSCASLLEAERSRNLLHEGLAERESAIAAMQAETADLRSALSRAELEGVEASAIAEGIWAEIASSRIVPNSAEREARERGDNEKMQAEIASLRSALSEAARHRQHGEAATSALQAQVTALNDQLAVAREVGRTALASLQIEAAILPEAPRNAGRLAPVLRFFGYGTRPPSPVTG